MKKLLLGLGAVSVAILPMAAMVSCSASAELQTELDKFVNTTATNGKTMMAPAIVTEFTTAADQTAKNAVIMKYYTVPTLTAGYTYNFLSVTATGNTDLNIEVQVTKTKTSTTAEEVATTSFVLSGFGQATPTVTPITGIAAIGIVVAVNTQLSTLKTNLDTLISTATKAIADLYFTGITDANLPNLVFTATAATANYTSSTTLAAGNAIVITVKGKTGFSVGNNNAGMTVSFSAIANTTGK